MALFSQITLNDILQLNNPEAVTGSAEELLGVCQHLADCVQRGESAEELVDAYGYIPAAWVGFSRQFRGTRNPKVSQAIDAIQHSVVALRDPLHLTAGLDLQAAAKLAGSIQLLGEHLGEDVEHWLNSREGRNVPFRQELARDVATFVNTAAAINASLQANRTAGLETSCEGLAKTWERVYPSVTKCNTDERDHLLSVSQRITSALVELEAMLLL